VIYIHGVIVVIGDGEVGQFAQVHVSSSSDGVHNEDVRGETQGATCMLGGQKAPKKTLRPYKYSHNLAINLSVYKLCFLTVYSRTYLKVQDML